MQTSPRTEPIVLLVAHTNEGPETEGGAQGLANYLQTIDGGYNAVFDDHSTVVVADDQTVVWGAGGVNGVALHGCFIHFSANAWTDQYSIGELSQGAAWFAEKCKAYGIPATRLSAADVHTRTVKGICGHVDVSATFPESMGHTDPGPLFPWTSFLTLVQAHLTPAPPKVVPMYWPNLSLAARLRNPGGKGHVGGWWLGYDNGVVDFLGDGGEEVRGGMISENDLKNFALHGEHLSQLVPRTRQDGSPGFEIVAQDGNKYIPENEI